MNVWVWFAPLFPLCVLLSVLCDVCRFISVLVNVLRVVCVVVVSVSSLKLQKWLWWVTQACKRAIIQYQLDGDTVITLCLCQVDYMDDNDEYFQRQASHRQSRRRFRKINQCGERQTIIDTVDHYPVSKPPLPPGNHSVCSHIYTILNLPFWSHSEYTNSCKC